MFVILAVVFVIIFGVFVGCVLLTNAYFKSRQSEQIRTMLRNAEATADEQRNPNLLRDAQSPDALGALLERFHFAQRISLVMDQAGSSSTPGKLVMSSVLLSLVLFLLGLKFHFSLSPMILSPITGLLGLFLPTLLLLKSRSKNIASFEEQFPEALDFLSRSMRAGHGFSVALEMLAADSPDPLGRSFRRVSNDMALGSSLEVALSKLVTLVPIVDVRFFVSSVVLQQETGGNLGEILTKLSYIIRERFRLKGQVKAVSAHGRITGLVLLLMPLGVAGFMMLTNPKYLTGLADHPIGRLMIYGALGGQVVGYFVINKIIAIKV